MESEPKTSPEYDKFTALVDRVLAVPHSEILKRQEDHRRDAAEKPLRPGPKAKSVKRLS